MNGMGSAFGGRSIGSDRQVRRSVCVFCSSAGGLPETYRSAARDLGRELARRGHRLVYGGGNVGLMGELARSVHEHGGTVVGVIPQGLVDRELAYDRADELLVTETLRDHNDTFLVKSFQLAPAITRAGKWCDGAISFGHGR